MAWRDFFYFSKGERMAFLLLTVLIVTTAVLLFLFRVQDEQRGSSAETTPAPTATDSTAVATTPAATSSGVVARTRPSERTETTRERVKRLTSSQPAYARTEKYAAGVTVEINDADTAELKKIPGIGSAFARRIVKYRDMLGGFYSVEQLKEVYGIDEEKYAQLSPWFKADGSHLRTLSVNTLSRDSLSKHPYINYRQAKAIEQLRKQKKRLTGWENLQLLDEFTEADKQRILPYLSFE
ncbi:MAG: helix-hairpin-helix domain-containing protein [Tannerella sp.]|jgi:competence ComEA-like helix-hairpin-helix protein|nr:helix-hairpin-helix domain-containing protein [Tannerella sp.]